MTAPRPTQVTAAVSVVVTGSLVVVVAAFSQVATLHSLDTRQEIESYLASSSGSSLGLGVQGIVDVVGVASAVAAACAAATAILGWFVLQRSRGSRLALSVLAVPLFLAGLTSDGFRTNVVSVAGPAAAVVAAAAAMLWLQPARAWVNGVDPPPRPATGPPPSPSSRPTPPAWPAPPATYDRDALLKLPPPSAPPLGAALAPSSPATSASVSSGSRPTAVVWACLLTWGVALFALLVFGDAFVSMLTDTQKVLDQMHRQNPNLAAQGISDTTLKVAIYVTTAVGVVWSLAATALAALAWRRVRWAAIGLLVATVLVAGLGLLMVRSDVRRWYADRPG